MSKRSKKKSSWSGYIYAALGVIAVILLLWAIYLAAAPYREIRDGASFYPESGAGTNP